MNRINGMAVIVEPLYQRYVLPADVPPPPGMTRDEFNDWSRHVCGFTEPLLRDGQVIVNERKGTLHMNYRTFQQLRKATDYERP